MLKLKTQLERFEWKVFNNHKPVGTIRVNGNEMVTTGSTPRSLDGYKIAGMYEDETGELWIIQWSPTKPLWKPHKMTYRCWRYTDLFPVPNGDLKHLLLDARKREREINEQERANQLMDPMKARLNLQYMFACYYFGRKSLDTTL